MVRNVLEEFDARAERTQEMLFFGARDALHMLAARAQFREGVAHRVRNGRNEPVDERLPDPQRLVPEPHGAAQNTPNDIGAAHIAGRHAIRYGKGDGARMIGDHAHGYAAPFALRLVLHADIVVRDDFLPGRKRRHPGKQGRKQVRVVIRPLALQNRHQPLQSQPGVHMYGRKRFKRPARQRIVLNEHEIPQLDDFRVIRIDQVLAGRGPPRFVRAQVDMHFRTWPARPLVPHHPEIVLRRKEKYVRRVDVRFGFP